MSALAEIERERLLVIVRADDPPDHVPEALSRAGVRVIEVSLVSNGALAAIERWRERHPELTVGAGTVRNGEDCARAAGAGAAFAISPGLEPGVAERAEQERIPYIPGALTPSELASCMRAGAQVVKLFPADSVGPGHLRALRGPFPGARVLATGGIDTGNARAWLDAGAVALAAGSSVLRSGADAAEIEESARALVSVISSSDQGEA